MKGIRESIGVAAALRWISMRCSMPEPNSPIIVSVLLAALMVLGLGIVVLLLWRRREEMMRFERIHRERSKPSSAVAIRLG